MSNNEKNGKTTELFFDLTMSDDNDLLTLVKEEEENGPLSSIETSTTAETSIKKQQNNTSNTLNTNISIDLTNAENLDLTQLDDLVKETEELIETISATVQESSKISLYNNENVEKIDVDSITETLLTPKEETKDAVVEEVKPEDTITEADGNVEINITPIEPIEVLEETAITFEQAAPTEIKEENDIVTEENNNELELNVELSEPVEVETILEPVIEKQEENVENTESILEPYIPHFISEELFQNFEKSTATIDGFVDYYNNSEVVVDKHESQEKVIKTDEQVLNQTGSFLFNTKNLSATNIIESQEEENITAVPEPVELPKEQKQVIVKQSIDDGQMLQISSIIHNIIEEATKVEDETEQTEIVVEEKELDITTLNQSKDEFDIDSLLKRLDEISGKEMLTSVAPKDKNEPVMTEEAVQEEPIVEEISVEVEPVIELSPTEEAEEKMKELVEKIIIPNDEKVSEPENVENTVAVEEVEKIIEPIEKVTITAEDTKLPELTKTGLEVNDIKINLTDLPELQFHKQQIEELDVSTTINDVNVTIPDNDFVDIEATEEAVVVVEDNESVKQAPIIEASPEGVASFKDTDTVTTLVNIPVVEEMIEEKVEVIATPVGQNKTAETEISSEVIQEEVQETQTRKAKKNTMNTILLFVIIALAIVLMVLIYLLLR